MKHLITIFISLFLLINIVYASEVSFDISDTLSVDKNIFASNNGKYIAIKCKNNTYIYNLIKNKLISKTDSRYLHWILFSNIRDEVFKFFIPEDTPVICLFDIKSDNIKDSIYVENPNFSQSFRFATEMCMVGDTYIIVPFIDFLTIVNIKNKKPFYHEISETNTSYQESPCYNLKPLNEKSFSFQNLLYSFVYDLEQRKITKKQKFTKYSQDLWNLKNKEIVNCFGSNETLNWYLKNNILTVVCNNSKIYKFKFK